MSEEKVLAEGDNPKNLIILGTVGVCALALAVIVIGVNQFFKFAVRDEVTERVLAPESTLKRELKAQEQKHLTKYQWVDQKAGVVRIPLDRAMELTLRDWDKRPETAPQPETAPAQAPAPAPAKP